MISLTEQAAWLASFDPDLGTEVSSALALVQRVLAGEPWPDPFPVWKAMATWALQTGQPTSLLAEQAVASQVPWSDRRSWWVGEGFQHLPIPASSDDWRPVNAAWAHWVEVLVHHPSLPTDPSPWPAWMALWGSRSLPARHRQTLARLATSGWGIDPKDPSPLLALPTLAEADIWATSFDQVPGWRWDDVDAQGNQAFAGWVAQVMSWRDCGEDVEADLAERWGSSERWPADGHAWGLPVTAWIQHSDALTNAWSCRHDGAPLPSSEAFLPLWVGQKHSVQRMQRALDALPDDELWSPGPSGRGLWAEALAHRGPLPAEPWARFVLRRAEALLPRGLSATSGMEDGDPLELLARALPESIDGGLQIKRWVPVIGALLADSIGHPHRLDERVTGEVSHLLARLVIAWHRHEPAVPGEAQPLSGLNAAWALDRWPPSAVRALGEGVAHEFQRNPAKVHDDTERHVRDRATLWVNAAFAHSREATAIGPPAAEIARKRVRHRP